ncbi:tape measure protein [Arthrobacter phage Wyborn]|uniref:Tape measure protein n=1 Tax=Arthrobacter phage Wyborn TaxID=3059067 RepID=A0AA96GUN4_9CAUD|nr:tape measure protein [Arthrobacter phage Wyborn]
MAEERVVLTAELRDEMSAPLDSLQSKVKSTERTISDSAKKQAASTKSSSTTILSALEGQGAATGTLSGKWNKLSSVASGAWGGAKNAVVQAGQKIIRASRDAGEDSGKQMSDGFGSKLKGALGGLAAAAGAKMTFDGLNSAVNTFSELEDSSAAAGVVFGKNMGDITALAASAGEKLGLTQQQVVSSATTFGSYGKMAGMAGKDLSKFASDQTAMAADLASFWGKSPEQAIEAIGAAYRGEAEPMRAFGVMIDENTLKNEAMKQGLIKTTKDALTPANKILATRALILNSTKDAQGDFARTMNSTANVQKRLEAATTNLSAKFGSLLAPAFTAARLKALGAVNAVSSLLDKVIAAKAVMKGGGTNKDIAAALGLSPEAAQRFSDIVGPIRAFFGAYRDGTSDVTSSGIAGVFEQLGGVLGRVHAGLTIGRTEIVGLGNDIDPLVGRVAGLKARFSELLQNMSPAQWAGVAGGAGLLLASFGKFAPMMSPIVGMFAKMGPLVGQLGGSLKFLLGPIGLLAGLLIYAYATSEPFRMMVNTLVTSLLSLAMTLMTSLMPVFSQLMTTLLPVIVSLFQSLVPVITQLLIAIVPVVVTLAAQLIPVFMQLITMVLPIVTGLIVALVPVFLMLLQALVPIIPPVLQIAMALLNLAVAVITPLMPLITMLAGLLSGILVGAISAVTPIVKFLIDGFSGLVNFLKGPLTSAIDVVAGIFKGLGDIISGVMDGIGDFMSNPMGGIQDMLGLPKNSGGGVYSGGGVVGAARFAGGGTLGGYAPGRDIIPALLSPGESVLVPELTRAIGPGNIMAANRIASGGRAAGSGPSLTGGYSNTASSGGGSATIVAEGAVQINIIAQDGKISEDDIETIKRVIEDIFDDHESRGY